MPIPKSPASSPIMNVSALNTRATSAFDAPTARRTPISFVLSSTEMLVMTPIIIDETTSDIPTNAISTYDTAFITVETDDISSLT
ncbi:unknown [Candidatus Colimorpha enterica]|uniref:Uncharacterized protein n=1 Tax=Candidatus Colimorpha enterica TaxID=3083063 RepID=R6U0T7_9BACT|nr:unknown [Candidatus Colimorpha enterica]